MLNIVQSNGSTIMRTTIGGRLLEMKNESLNNGVFRDYGLWAAIRTCRTLCFDIFECTMQKKFGTVNMRDLTLHRNRRKLNGEHQKINVFFIPRFSGTRFQFSQSRVINVI